jgi:DNA primase
MEQGALRARVDALLARVDLVSLVGSAVPLSRGHNPRGKCPFHGSKSDSLAVYPDSGRFRCWGCGEGGDAIKFLELMFGLSFMDALARLEAENGLDGLAAQPAKREKRAQRPVGREPISSAEMGRVLWAESVVDCDSIRTYLLARAVPEPMLDADRLWELRFHPSAPIAAWVEGGRERVATAPAILASVRGLPSLEPQAVHATFLSPNLTGKMVRFDGRGEPLPARKFLGSVGGGGVLFGSERGLVIDRGAPLFAAEGIETLLSGMALLDAPADAVGLALLSLDNLQGGWLGVRKRGVKALPLHDPEPDPERPPVCFAHDGPVTGLIDADMKPLPRQNVIAMAGWPPEHRALTSAERSQLCAALFAKSWRRAGCRRVRTVRPPMGQDFNDLAASRSGVGTFRCPSPGGDPTHSNRGSHG